MPKVIDHDLRRRELVEASWAVIAAEGLDGLTMRKIASAAKCTTGRLTHYFANREELVLATLRAVYDAASARMADTLSLSASPRAQLQAMLEECLPLDAMRLREWKIWIAFWSAATTDKRLALENDARHDRWHRALTPLIGKIAPKLDAAHEADCLIGLVNGLGLQAAINPSRANKARALTTLTAHVAALGRAV
jgi:AcrR family transcriptional regulator